MTAPTHQLFGYPVWSGTLSQSRVELVQAAENGESGYAVFCNVHMSMEGLVDRQLAAAMHGARWIFPDGRPVSLGVRLLHGVTCEQVAGPATMEDCCALAADRGWSVYLYGGAQAVLDRLTEQLPDLYPGLRVAGACSPPFRALTDAEEAVHCQAINQSGATFCMVALGCPKQELWMARNVHRVRPLMFGVGAAFPMIAGLTPRAPAFLSKLCLEWLYRLAQEPKRLWQRYATTNPRFINRLLRALWGRWS